MYQNKIKDNIDISEIDLEHMYSDFKQFVIRKESEFDFSMEKKDETELKIRIKFIVIRNLFGIDRALKWNAYTDKYINKALDVLNN